VVNNFGINANGANAKSDGVEFNATARLEGGLTLSANGAYTDAKLDGDTSALVGGKKGDQLPFTPKLSLGCQRRLRLDVGDKQAYVGASLRHAGQAERLLRQHLSAPPTAASAKVPSYEVVDLRAGIELRQGRPGSLREEPGRRRRQGLDFVDHGQRPAGLPDRRDGHRPDPATHHRRQPDGRLLIA
jgi:outer membrane receptor protein involved in Fe transport